MKKVMLAVMATVMAVGVVGAKEDVPSRRASTYIPKARIAKGDPRRTGKPTPVKPSLWTQFVHLFI